MKQKTNRLLIALLLISALVLSGCGTPAAPPAATPPAAAPDVSASAPPVEKKVVTMAFGAAWSSLSPFTTGSTYNTALQLLIFDKLVTIQNNGDVLPRLLESWEFSDDGLVLTGKINPRAAWTDGVPVSADDIVFTFETYTNPAVPSAVRISHFAGTDEAGLRIEGQELGVKAIDAKTVEFTLKEPTLPLIFFSATEIILILPKHLLAEVPPENLLEAEFFTKPVGSGPFKFHSQTQGTEIQLDANHDYFLGQPPFEQFNIRVVTADALWPNLLSKDIDLTSGTGLANLPIDDFNLANQNSDFAAKSVPQLGSTFICINNQQDNLNNASIRRGLETAIDKQAIVDNLLKGQGTVSYSPISHELPYYSPDLRVNAYDPEKARQLLEEGNFDFDKPLKLLVSTGNTLREQTVVLIQQNFAAVGVKLEIQLIDFASIMGILIGGTEDYDLAVIGRSSNSNPGLYYNFFEIGSSTNFSRITDRSIFDLYKKAEVSRSVEEAQGYYYEMEQLVQDQVPFIYLYHANDLLVYNQRIRNIDTKYYYVTDNLVEWQID